MEFVDFIELAYWVIYPGLSAYSGGRYARYTSTLDCILLLSVGQNLP